MLFTFICRLLILDNGFVFMNRHSIVNDTFLVRFCKAYLFNPVLTI